MTFTLSQGYPKAHHFETLCKGYLLAKFQYSNINSVRDIVKKLWKMPFFHLKADAATLTLRQCHTMAHLIIGRFTTYLWIKLHNSTVNSFRDNGNDKVCDGWTVRQTDGRTDGHWQVITYTQIVYINGSKIHSPGVFQSSFIFLSLLLARRSCLFWKIPNGPESTRPLLNTTLKKSSMNVDYLSKTYFISKKIQSETYVCSLIRVYPSLNSPLEKQDRTHIHASALAW